MGFVIHGHRVLLSLRWRRVSKVEVLLYTAVAVIELLGGATLERCARKAATTSFVIHTKRRRASAEGS